MTENLSEILKNNPYPGRGIVTGMSDDGKYAVCAYFIMGRSENSRNRIFKDENGDIVICPFDESKVEDPSLIIYSPVRRIDRRLIVTNGDQTDTIYDYLKDGKTFEEALNTRTFEPDSPNYTPRISAVLDFTSGYSYKQSIIKSTDGKGGRCGRYTFSFEPESGIGHFIHTYMRDSSPLPPFEGEPERVYIGGDIGTFSKSIWESLDADNRISLYVRFTAVSDRTFNSVIINKNL